MTRRSRGPAMPGPALQRVRTLQRSREGTGEGSEEAGGRSWVAEQGRRAWWPVACSCWDKCPHA